MRRVRLLLIIVTAIVLLLMAVPAYAAPAASTSAGASGPQCVQWYTIQCGDTLSKIANRFGASVAVLAQRNNICNPNVIYAGQTICVRWGAAPPPPPPPPPGGGFWYTVKPGDMLRVIAARYGLGTWELARVNHIPNPDRIWAGQRLWIPQ